MSFVDRFRRALHASFDSLGFRRLGPTPLLAGLLLLPACGGPRYDDDGFRAVVLQRMLDVADTLSRDTMHFRAACVTRGPDEDPAASIQAPSPGLMAALSSPLELRAYPDCVDNPARPGFRWNATQESRDEVMVGIQRVDTLTHRLAVLSGIWLASGSEGAFYRCVARRRLLGPWKLESCDQEGWI